VGTKFFGTRAVCAKRLNRQLPAGIAYADSTGRGLLTEELAIPKSPAPPAHLQGRLVFGGERSRVAPSYPCCSLEDVAMRTSLDPAPVFRPRAAFTALLLTGLLAAAPAAGQAIVKPGPETAVADFQKFLPPVAPVPWLDARWRAPQKSVSPLPEAGSLSALLLAPDPVSSWTSGPSHAASARVGFVGM